MSIYYDETGYPHFDLLPDSFEEFGFIHNNYQNPVFIFNIEKVFDILAESGMSPQECVDYFKTEDTATCRVDHWSVG